MDQMKSRKKNPSDLPPKQQTQPKAQTEPKTVPKMKFQDLPEEI